jgi:ribonuclease P protein component
MEKFTFKKSERLSQKKLIQELFDKGSSFYLYPFKVFFAVKEAPTNQILVSVSKSLFKRAVDRNTIKRRIREGYRLNKWKLPSDNFFFIAYIYTGQEVMPSTFIHQKLVLTFNKLIEKK